MDLWPDAWVDENREKLDRELPVREPPPADLLGIDAPADAEWVGSRLTPHPLHTYTQPVPEVEDSLPGVFIHCTTGPLADLFGGFAQRARDRGWPVHEIATGHCAMMTEPPTVARLLHRCAPR